MHGKSPTSLSADEQSDHWKKFIGSLVPPAEGSLGEWLKADCKPRSTQAGEACAAVLTSCIAGSWWSPNPIQHHSLTKQLFSFLLCDLRQNSEVNVSAPGKERPWLSKGTRTPLQFIMWLEIQNKGEHYFIKWLSGFCLFIVYFCTEC